MAPTASIDYWSLVSRSLRIIWKHKFLWFFGFFAAGSGSSGFNWVNDAGPYVRDFFLVHPGVFVLIIMGLVLFWLVMFVMNLISTGALVSAVREVSRGGCATFGGAWREGLAAFWRLLGVTVLAIVAFVVVTGLCAIPIVLAALGGTPGIVIAVVIGAVRLLPYLAFMFLLTFTVTYAEREVVLERAGVFEAISAGWDLTKRHIWKSLLVWLIMLASGIAFGLGLVLVLLILAVPFILIGLANVFAALVIGIPIGVVVVVVASGAFGSYAYSVWTLTYEELKRIDRGSEEASGEGRVGGGPPSAWGEPDASGA
jgi:hypothetical protein